MRERGRLREKERGKERGKRERERGKREREERERERGERVRNFNVAFGMNHSRNAAFQRSSVPAFLLSKVTAHTG